MQNRSAAFFAFKVWITTKIVLWGHMDSLELYIYISFWVSARSFDNKQAVAAPV